MKKVLLLLLLISSKVFGQSSGDLDAIYLGYDPIHQKSFSGTADYDPSAADWTLLAGWADSNIHAFGDHCVDAVNNRWYQVYGDSLNMYLLMIDIPTGDTLHILFTVDSVGQGLPGTVTIGGNIGATFYNCKDNSVYFIHYKAPWEDSIHLAKVNVDTYVVTELAKFPIGTYAIDNISTPNQLMYFLYYDYFANVSRVITYNLGSNLSSAVDISLVGFNAGELILTCDPTSGMLYGIDYDLDSFSYNNYLADLRAVSLDPVTGQLTFLTPDYLGNVVGANMSLDGVTDKMYFLAQQSNPGYIDLGICDLTNNTISFEVPTYTNPIGPYTPTLFGLNIYNPPFCSSLAIHSSDSAICEKFCVNFFDSSLNDPTAWLWKFPGASPSASTDQNPANICYNNPGTYDVTLITTSASGNDTLLLTNYITVFATPPPPTIAQNGYVLTSSAGSAYQWQYNSIDIPGATNQSYNVTQTGLYTVLVYDPNGCKNSASQYVQIVGINEVKNGITISVFPNPNNGSFTVELLNAQVSGTISIRLTNALGQLIYSSSEEIQAGHWKKGIILPSAASSIYFLEISTREGYSRSKIMVTD